MRIYTFIRRNIPIQQQLVQAAHSAAQAGAEFLNPKHIPSLIMLDANDQCHLLEVAQYLCKNGIKFHMFFEPDNQMGYSSITTEPVTLEQRQIFSQFKLWRP